MNTTPLKSILFTKDHKIHFYSGTHKIYLFEKPIIFTDICSMLMNSLTRNTHRIITPLGIRVNTTVNVYDFTSWDG